MKEGKKDSEQIFRIDDVDSLCFYTVANPCVRSGAELQRLFIMMLIGLTLHSAHAERDTTTLPIKKVVIFGHKLHSHTHSYIHWAFHRAFTHLGYETHWFDNNDDVSNFDFANTLFITEGQVDQNIPIRDDCFYIIHNTNAAKYRKVLDEGRVIVLQVYTHDCLNYHLTKLEEGIYVDVGSSLIHMPWATDLLPHEIEANKQKIPTERNRHFVFIGTIGNGVFGNIEHIEPFQKAAEQSNVSLQHLSHCSMETNIDLVQKAYMAPAIQGSWQVKQGYIPCRIFKNISYGAFGITNSKTVYDLFGGKIVYNENAEQLFHDAKKKIDSLDVRELHELMDFVKERHTYINRINTLLTFLETVYLSKNLVHENL